MEYRAIYVDEDTIKVYDMNDNFIRNFDYEELSEIIYFESNKMILNYEEILEYFEQSVGIRDYFAMSDCIIKLSPFIINDIKAPEYFLINDEGVIKYLYEIEDLLNVMNINDIMKYHKKYLR